MQDVISQFMGQARIATRAEVLASPSPVPAEGGVYGWWFRALPTAIDTAHCATRDGLTLLYVGISPKAPPANGRPPSRQGLRARGSVRERIDQPGHFGRPSRIHRAVVQRGAGPLEVIDGEWK